MEKAILDMILSQGIWTILSFFLIYYIIKIQEKRDESQEKREHNYQKILSELSKNFNLLHKDIDKIKKELDIY